MLVETRWFFASQYPTLVMLYSGNRAILCFPGLANDYNMFVQLLPRELKSIRFVCAVILGRN